MPTFARDDISFFYRDAGTGTPFVFQHGLGGDVHQPFGFFEEFLGDTPPFRLIAMDCRAHGDTQPVGPEDKISFNAFADDVVALMDHLELGSAVAGGISMGAGVALNIATRYPERVCGLVLSRPAWLDAPMPGNLDILTRIATLIRRYGSREGRERFLQSEEYTRVRAEAPDVAQTALSQFDNPRAEDAVVRLERMPHDVPCADRALWSQIGVPTLVLVNQWDPLHPHELGTTIAAAIPGAELREITSKSSSLEAHTRDVQRHVIEFFAQHIDR
ncbi:MAG: alpha/beta hydrolase [Candidatus Hydrogenedentes bacterium]|nr:alpha/beta hydrolase [Candidatus Hydrogenedentota bacterium]